MIPQKMKSSIQIELPEKNLYEVTDIQVDIKQGDLYANLTATVTGFNILIAGIPTDVAAMLNYKKPLSIQVLCTDADGMPWASEIGYVNVQQILRSGTYGD